MRAENPLTNQKPNARRLFGRKLLWIIVIFTAALGVRWLTWQDLRFEAAKVQEFVAKDYQTQARAIQAEGVLALFDPGAESASINFMLHPPGYPLILAAAFGVFGDSETTIQTVSIVADALSCVLIFLIASELLSLGVAAFSGLLAAFAPQFATNSIWLLPDALAVVPILAAVYCLIRALEKPIWWRFLLCGALVGASCLIRANALLLAPFLAIVGALFLFKERRLIKAIILVAGAILVVAPLTIRNYVVFNHFIPISLGAGQTLIEGIGDYDKDNRFNFPRYDWDVFRQEAELYNRPDYADNLIQVDGIKRDRLRTARAFKFILENPIWFAGVMSRRALWMTTPEKTETISFNIPISKPLTEFGDKQPAAALSPIEIAEKGAIVSSNAKIWLAPENDWLFLQTDREKYAAQFASGEIEVEPNTENVLRLQMVLRQGRIKIQVRAADSAQIRAQTIVDPLWGKTAADEQLRTVSVPFVVLENKIRFVIANEAPPTAQSLVEIQIAEVVSSGAARNAWTRPLRLIVAPLQKIFSLPVLLPLELIGLGLLLWRGERKTILILMLVPFYYFFVQSALHTEYRYVLVIHHFLFVLAASAIGAIFALIISRCKEFQIFEKS